MAIRAAGNCAMAYLVAFSVCLCLCAASEESSSLVSSVDIVQKGKHCVQVAKDVIEAVSQSKAELAMGHLRSLKQDSEHLMRYAQSRISLLEGERNGLLQQLTKLEEQIGEYGRRENSLKINQKKIEATLDMERRTCYAHRRQVREAEAELQRAERELQAAKRSEDATLVLGGIAGMGLAYCTGGLSLAVLPGLFLGLAGGKVLNTVQGNVDRAKRHLQDSKWALRGSETAVQKTEQHITTLEKQLSEILAEIRSRERESNKLHGETKKLKEAIAFQMEAAELWTMFQTAIEDAGVKTETLRKIIEKASEKRNWNILRSDGTKLVEATFLEAWEEVETTTHDGLLIERRAFAKHLSPWFYSVVISCTVSISSMFSSM